MQFIFLISLLLSLQVPQNAKKDNAFKAYKRTTSFKKIPQYNVLPRSTMYYITNKVNHERLTYILTYMQIFLCFNFTKETSKIIDKPGINFFRSNKVNKVILSTKRNKPTRVYLKEHIYNNDKKLSFYVGLAFGLIPEITRYDRSNNVKVYFQNISAPFKRYYKTKKHYHKTYYETEFDFGSIMLFNPHFGSKKKKLTYQPISLPYDMKFLGIHRSFSYNDRKHLYDMFCSKQCKVPNDCKNGGFPGRDCEHCYCPIGFFGKKCEDIYPNLDYCGKKTYWASSKKQTLSIKTIHDRCIYSILSKSKKKINVIIEKLKIVSSAVCEKDYGIEIKYRKDKGATGLILCGNYTNIVLPSESSEVYVLTSGSRYNNKLKIAYQEVEK